MHTLKRSWQHLKNMTLSVKQKVMIYSVLGFFLVGSGYQLKTMGYTPNTLIFQIAIPRHQDHPIGRQLFEQWIYFLTDLKWNEPSSYILSRMPIHQGAYLEKLAAGNVKGYFEQDENTYLAETELENYKPQVPKPSTQQDYSAFRDKAYVYSHYFTAPGKMEFDLDMLAKWDFYDLVTKPIQLNKEEKGPKVLIFHTHAREEYKGKLTVLDIGQALADTLESKYGIETLHVTDEFYEVSNKGNRPTGGEYERMEPVIQRILREHPSISVVIDLHRDGVNENVHLITDINGKQAAKVMFVNGLCLNRNMAGEVEEKKDLPNPYIGDNLALSLQMSVQLNENYPGLARKIYLNEWRYSTHMKANSLLLEWGAQTNTDQEAMNSVEPVAEILSKVLQKD